MTIFITLLLLTLIFTFPNITWKEDLQLLILLITLIGFRKNKKIATGIMALTFLFLISQLFDPYVTSLRSGIADYVLYFNILKIIVFTLLTIICILYFKYRKLNLKLSTISYQLSTIAVVIVILLTGTARAALAPYSNKVGNYKKAIILNPIYCNAHLNLAKQYEKKKNWIGAGQEYKKLSILSGGYNKYLFTVGMSFIRAGDWNNAYLNLIGIDNFGPKVWQKVIQAFETIVAKEPNDSNNYYNLAIAYKNNNEIDKAIEGFKNALSLNPQIKNAHYNLGLIYEGDGLIDESTKKYEKEIKINPKNLNTYLRLKELYKKQGNLEKLKECERQMSIYSSLLLECRKNLYSTGTPILRKINLPNDKSYRIAIIAKGSIGNYVWPIMHVQLDNTEIGKIYVNSNKWTVYQLPILRYQNFNKQKTGQAKRAVICRQTETGQAKRTVISVKSGEHKISIAFTNDYYNPENIAGGKDRNLYVSKVIRVN